MSRWTPQQTHIRKLKNGYVSVKFADIVLKFGFLVAEIYSQHILQVRLITQDFFFLKTLVHLPY